MSDYKRTKIAKKPRVIVPVQLPGDVASEIRTAANESGLSDQDILRLAVRRGLPSVRKSLGTVAA